MRRIVIGVSAVLALSAARAEAAEGGASFYLLGSGGPGAGILPSVQGLYLDNTIYGYFGDAGASHPLLLGGNLALGLDADIVADFPTLLWVPATDFLGGTLGLGAALPVGDVSVDANVDVTGPGGARTTVTRSDSALVVGDPVISAALGWSPGGNFHLSPSATLNIPLGTYREDELANLAFHRWILDASMAATWRDEESGWDVSAKIGFTFNGTNEYTDYTSGDDFHAEAAIEKTLSPKFSLGVLGYYYEQISGDSGAGAILGPNEGKVAALGVTGAVNFELGGMPASLRARLLQEFDAERRMEGTAVFLSFDVPLSLNLPAGAQ